MTLFDIAAILITLSAVFSYLNHRYIRLPTTIGIMAIALAMSLVLLALGWLGLGLEAQADNLLRSIDFNETLLGGMLSFLLFAGALHVNLGDLVAQKGPIAFLATFGVILSTLLVALGVWWTLGFFGLELPFIYCLLFGALISPTDPIAVLSILKTSGAPKSLETKISGESLFNDGVGVVVFLVLLEVAKGTAEPEVVHVLHLLLQETGGGVLLGLATGYVCYRMLRSVDNYQVEILLTLALVAGGYALAGILHISGPIAVVVAGLLIGNHGRLLAMSNRTRRHLDTFWELVDEILNAVLFVLIGLEVLVITIRPDYLGVGLAAIVIVLVARFVTVGLPVIGMRRFREFTPNAIKILTWGGLRGGISVALALSLPPGPQRQLILSVTYTVVVFSILVQGLTIGKLIEKTGVGEGPDPRLEA